MSRSKAELSVTERLIIQLVIYRTKNPKHPTFFGDNKNIAKYIDVQPDTVRKAIAKLVKLKYLQLGYDKQGRRHMVYTGKEFAPIIENMNNIDKKSLYNEKRMVIKDKMFYHSATGCCNTLWLAERLRDPRYVRYRVQE